LPSLIFPSPYLRFPSQTATASRTGIKPPPYSSFPLNYIYHRSFKQASDKSTIENASHRLGTVDRIAERRDGRDTGLFRICLLFMPITYFLSVGALEVQVRMGALRPSFTS